MQLHTTIVGMVHNLKLSSPITQHIAQVDPQCSQIHAIPKTTYTTHTTRNQWEFVHIHVGHLWLWTSISCNHCGCNHQLATHGNCTCGTIIALDLHPNMSIAPAHMVAMSVNRGCIWNPSWLVAIAKCMVANVKTVTHGKISSTAGPWVLKHRPPLLVGTREGMAPHYMQQLRQQPP